MSASVVPLQQLHQQGLISALDLHFTRFIERLAGAPCAELSLAALLASFETGNGNVCVNLPLLAGKTLFDSLFDNDNERVLLTAPQRQALQAPDWPRWAQILRAAANVVGQPGERRPLILDRHGRLYLYRYWDYEKRLAENLLQRAALMPGDIDIGQLQDALNVLFPLPSAPESDRGGNSESAGDWQKVAAATALLRRFCVISGGPGTGKTTTVMRILVLLLLQQHDQPLRIALAAPTGKAAARMQEAIAQAKRQLDLDDELLQQIPEQATTIHRLLGPRNNSVYFQHNRDNPLALDVLVIDEASMVDLALMSKLTDALPLDARLILLGDKDQLASVEAGAVLGDICGDVPGFSAAFRRRLQPLGGDLSTATDADADADADAGLADSIVLLRRSYRFGTDSGIGALARAINRGQGEQALALLTDERFDDIGWHDIGPDDTLAQLVAATVEAGFQPYLQLLRDPGARPEQIFDAFNRFRVLCALRNGPFGVSDLNRLIERILEARRWLRIRETWYAGRPVMITRNDYPLRLYNGDIGIALADTEDQGRLKVFFTGSDGQIRKLPVLRLPEHETVYAMTIHKSQGSEFDQVMMLLPPELSRVTGRELIYTGITRARRRVTIWGHREVFSIAVGRALQRSSGLRERLWPKPLKTSEQAGTGGAGNAPHAGR